MTALTPQQKDPIGAPAEFLALLDLIAPPLEVVSLGPDGPRIRYRDEADIRRAIARLAFAYGWEVQEEVVIPGWGRIDIVLSDPSPGSILLELKVELARPYDIRRAFQQADGYGRWWKANKDEPANVVLAAAKANADLIAPVGAAYYPSVVYREIAGVMGGLECWGDPKPRIGVAQERADRLSNLLEIHDYAVKRLAGGAS